MGMDKSSVSTVGINNHYLSAIRFPRSIGTELYCLTRDDLSRSIWRNKLNYFIEPVIYHPAVTPGAVTPCNIPNRSPLLSLSFDPFLALLPFFSRSLSFPCLPLLSFSSPLLFLPLFSFSSLIPLSFVVFVLPPFSYFSLCSFLLCPSPSSFPCSMPLSVVFSPLYLLCSICRFFVYLRFIRFQLFTFFIHV